ncbi:hypothetical protein KP509_10G058300 [Ceratopteris richardii]|uniref:D-aminoacyl-tRNA deacylase n=1 Tax=Ceratopteris richardii TaxID=49495 RepID=A0A8T2U590_CERRI|nr:hypothetical protein KP509_10G058300 [Ceratopteris richardii]
MRALVQRVRSARVEVDNHIITEIGPGLLVLVGFTHTDSLLDAESISKKILRLPLFASKETEYPLDLNVMQKNYELLLVSQFSLYGVFKGNRLDFHGAMPSEQAKPIYEALVEIFCQQYDPGRVKDGKFGIKRQVFAVNDGPLAIQLDSESNE